MVGSSNAVVRTLFSDSHIILTKFQCVSNAIDLQLTAPIGIALFSLVKKAPCATQITIPFAVIASKLTSESLLVNEFGRASVSDGSGV